MVEPIEIEAELDIATNERPDSILLKRVTGGMKRDHLWLRFNAVPKSKFNGMKHGTKVRIKGFITPCLTGRGAGHEVFRQVVSVMEINSKR